MVSQSKDNLPHQWWKRENFSRKKNYLLKRSKIIAELRHYFSNENFIEVDTAALQICPGTETHIAAIEASLNEPFTETSYRYFLHTSPEIAMKKLLIAGMEKIFQITHAWRNGERSSLHHPEFTILEWYRTNESYDSLMRDCQAILQLTSKVTERRFLVRHCDGKDLFCDPHLPCEFLEVSEAFVRYCDIDLLSSLEDPWKPNRDNLARQMAKKGYFFTENDQWDDLFFRIMTTYIEPHLGQERATILKDYPLRLAVSSRPLARDNRLAERFELYACGVEIANGFGELSDPIENRVRFKNDMDLKEQLYGERFPEDEDFFKALDQGLPFSSGIALGLDRLIMLACGAETLEQVIWTPITPQSPDF